MSGDYLFDPSSPPPNDAPTDADREAAARERAERESVEKLERALAPFRLREAGRLELPERASAAAAKSQSQSSVEGGPRAARQLAASRWIERRWLRLAAAGLIVAGGATFFVLRNGGRGGGPDGSHDSGGRGDVALGQAMALSDVEGAVRVDGDRVVCDAGGRARLRVGEIGWLTLEEKTRVRVVAGQHGEAETVASEPKEGAYRLDLERGTVQARIFAAPRVFWLGTPSGIAVDLGCVYRTTVDDEGHTTLAVVSGRVSFESDGHKVYVPAGASCRAWPNFGPGTPAWDDASSDLKAAAVGYDEARMKGDAKAARTSVERILTTERERDSLTLWHLLAVPEADLRAQVCDRLKELCPPPDEAPRDRVLALDAAALTAWREKLEYDCW